MNKEELKSILIEKFQLLYDYVDAQDDAQFEVHHTLHKWSTGQHVEHLRKSTKGLNIGLNINPLILRFKFGTIKRPNLSYQELVTKYIEKTGSGQEAPESFQPKEIPNHRKSEVLKWLDEEKNKMIQFIDRKSKKQLDSYCIPHPLLGKLSFTEFIAWNAAHTEHHLELIKKYNG